jgi:hypothetical protein
VLALVAAAALIVHLTRGTTFWFDEWNWALYRRAGGLQSLLTPYNGHFSLIPVAIYKILFATAGAGNYLPYRIMIVLGDMCCVALLYVYVRRRAGGYLALLAALAILFLGPAWQDILWPFQIAWLIAMAAGMGAFLMLDRRDTLGDVLACLLLVIALASTSVGVAITAGALVEVVLARRRLAHAWIVAIPIGLYLLWSIGYQNTSIHISGVGQVWKAIADSAAASLSVPLGLSGQTVANPTGTILAFGFPLLLGAVVLLWWRTRKLGAWPARAFSLSAVLLSFWILIALERSAPLAGRYLEVDALFALLLCSELARGLALRRSVGIVLGVITVAALISNIAIMRGGAAYLRLTATATRAELTGLSIARANIPPGYISRVLPGYPFVQVRASAYYAMERAIGTPADTQQQLASAPADARAVTDAQLVDAGEIRAFSAPARPAYGSVPTVVHVAETAIRAHAACLSVRQSPSALEDPRTQLVLTVPPGGLLVTTARSARVGVRRFGIGAHPLVSPSTRSAFVVRALPDAARQPWQLILQVTASATVCGLSGAT